MVPGFTYSADYDVPVNYGGADGWVLKVIGTAGMAENDDNIFQVFPNLFGDKITVSVISEVTKIEMFDAVGKLICCYENLPFNSRYIIATEDLEQECI